MFETLSDQIRHDELDVKPAQRILRWAMTALIAVALFGGLYLVVQHLE